MQESFHEKPKEVREAIVTDHHDALSRMGKKGAEVRQLKEAARKIHEEESAREAQESLGDANLIDKERGTHALTGEDISKEAYQKAIEAMHKRQQDLERARNKRSTD